MAPTRILSEFTYRSGIPSQSYRFTIVVDEQGLISCRNIQGPYGLIMDSYTSLPQSVHNDITEAISEVENLLAQTSAVNGTLVFTNSASESFVFSSPMLSATYRVVLSPDVFAGFRIINKTTAGFTIEATSTITGSVGFDVFI